MRDRVRKSKDGKKEIIFYDCGNDVFDVRKFDVASEDMIFQKVFYGGLQKALTEYKKD